MEDRIAALEGKVAELETTLDDLGMKYFGLKRAFTFICGPLAGAMGITPDQMRATREQSGVSAIWLIFQGVAPAISDRRGEVLQQELDDIFTALMKELETHMAAQPPEPIDRFAAMANAVSAAGVQLAESQRYKLATVLRNVNQKLASAAAIEELQGVLIYTDIHGDHSTDPEEKQRFQSLSEFIRQRIRDLSPR